MALAAGCLWAAIVPSDVNTIIQRSVEANDRDWKAAPQYNYFERDRVGDGTKTYQVLMIDGSPYHKLVAVDGKPLPASQQAREQHKLDRVIAQRRNESLAKRSARVAAFRNDRRQEHLLLSQLTKAFEFRMVGRRTLNNRDVYVLQATPLPDYRPPNRDSKVLTGMQGELWIDAKTFQCEG